MEVKLPNLEIAAAQRRLIIVALDTLPSLDEVEAALGVSPRQLERLLVLHKLKTRARRLKRARQVEAGHGSDAARPHRPYLRG